MEQEQWVHDFGWDEADPLCHEGIDYVTLDGYLLHRSVEKILYKVRIWLSHNDAVPFYHAFQAGLDLLFGLNCRFPMKDIALYMAWTLGLIQS